MPKKSSTAKTNLAQAPLSEREQRERLADIAFGENWQSLEREIDARLTDYPPDAPIRVSTRRALAMIKDMAFEKL